LGGREARVIGPFVCAGHVQWQLHPRAQKSRVRCKYVVHVHHARVVGREVLMLLGIGAH